MIKFIIFIIIAYIFGTFPCGVWLGKATKGIDIREHGSKNSGATNAYRILGAKYGIMVLILDALKGYIPLFIANMFGVEGKYLVILGLVAILGHSFSIFLNFKGGKGVATSLGVFIFLMPKVVLVLLAVFILIVSITKYVSLASIVCAGILPLLTLIVPLKAGIPKLPMTIIAAIIGIFVIYKHRANITRLREGKENKFKFK